MSNKASRARSPVGRTARPGGASSRGPRCLPSMMRIGLAAELFGEDAARHLLDRAARQVAELERPVGNADEPRHRQAQMLHHAAHLAVFAFGKAHGEPGVAALLP